MKKLICEMCGGTDLVKEDGVFLCQSCGCKYSVEEAKKMMVKGTVEVTGTVKIDDSDKIESYLEIGNNSLSGGNGESAFEYANKALEVDPQNVDAWLMQMQSIEYMGTIGDTRLSEVVSAGTNAMKFVTEDKKDEILFKVYFYYLTRALTLLKVATNRMADNQEIKDLFKRLALFNPFSAANQCIKSDATVVNLYDNVANEAIALTKEVPDYALEKYDGLPYILEQCAKQYKYETDALVNRYEIYGAELVDLAKQTRKNNERELEDRAVKAAAEHVRIVENERKANVEKYWNEHADEKVALENEINRIRKQISLMKIEIDSLPEQKDIKDAQERIDKLTSEKNSLGLFKGKEKRTLEEQIEREKQNISSIKSKFDDVKNKIQLKINPLKSRIKEIEIEMYSVRGGK